MRKRTKFLLLRFSIILTFAILAGRIWYVQVVMGSYYKQQADTSKIRYEPVQALRGILYDRNGVPLVFNAPSWTIAIVPRGVPSSGRWTMYRRLSSLLAGHPTASEIAAQVDANQWRAYAPISIKARVSTETAMIVKQMHSELPGVRAEVSSLRHYILDPQNSLSHILGYASDILPETYASYKRLYPAEHYGLNDTVGSDGVEFQMEPYLHGINGTQQVMVDSGERPVRTLRQAHTVPGDDVYLTIDSKLQAEVAGDLATALSRLSLKYPRAVAVVEDVHTGAVLAMVSLPSYDNNEFSGGIRSAAYKKLANDPSDPLLNAAIQGQYAPGSTFKIVTAAAALQTGVADAYRTIDDTGQIALRCPGTTLICQTFNGWKPGGLGPVNVVGALAQSSDIYMYTVAGGNPNVDPNMPIIGSNRLAAYAHEFGLGELSGIELPGEAAGFVPSATWFDNHKVDRIVKNPGEAWHIGNTYNMAIGQGQNIATPLQMANVAATIANGGTLYRPRIVQQIQGSLVPGRGALKRSTIIQPFVPSIIRKNFIDPGNIGLIQQGMHDSVDWTNWVGTSCLVRDPRIDAAGKTGTAEAPGGANAWWIGYAPFSNPQIAVSVVVPNASSEGAYTAAPIAHKIFEDYFHLKPVAVPGCGYGVWPTDVTQQEVPGSGAQ